VKWWLFHPFRVSFPRLCSVLDFDSGQFYAARQFMISSSYLVISSAVPPRKRTQFLGAVADVSPIPERCKFFCFGLTYKHFSPLLPKFVFASPGANVPSKTPQGSVTNGYPAIVSLFARFPSFLGFARLSGLTAITAKFHFTFWPLFMLYLPYPPPLFFVKF